MEYKITLKGSIPSKKNSKQIINVRGRPLIISSKNYLEWERKQIKEIEWNRPPLDSVKEIRCNIIAKDRRLFDLSNKFESIADMLVKRGVLKDDNYSIIPRVILDFGGVDKEKCGADVIIRE